MLVLIACEESQAVTTAFRKLGHEAFSCDLLPCSGEHPEWHIQGNVLDYLEGFYKCKCGIIHEISLGKYGCCGVSKLHEWDLIIAHPPCTHLSSSGQWAFSKGVKDLKLKNDSIDFFMKIANARCEKIVIENPIGIMSTFWRKPDQIIQPYMFGDLASKKTCLWLKGVAKLIPDTIEKPQLEYHSWIDKKTGKNKRMEKWMYDIRTKPHKERGKLSSKTFPGIAKAMAEQWGNDIKINKRNNKII